MFALKICIIATTEDEINEDESLSAYREMNCMLIYF